jgi:hypothetical protein
MLHLAALRVRMSSLACAVFAKKQMRYALPVVLLTLLGFSAPAFSQTCTGLCLQQVSCPHSGTTSISGTVYAPNGTDPLPNVLVYIPNAPVQAFTMGVACEQAGEPASGSPLVSTTSDYNGTFTLTNVPVGTNIPLVIQTGRWRRQIVIPNVGSCVNTGLSASQTRLPKTQLEGDIPKIAISTGSVDAIECVLRKIGIADSEFTDLNGVGRINLFGGATDSGAVITTKSPTETKLVASPTVLNTYDMVMFACQGESVNEKLVNQQNLIEYANAGGRLFLTHYGYDWLYNATPFSTTALWAPDTNDLISVPDQIGHIDQTFPRGVQLAKWLQFVGASPEYAEIALQDIRKDQNGVVAPTQSWMTVANPSDTVQFTFNTPVGAATAQQCGRVLFNEYHVEDTEANPTTGLTFPNECATGAFTPQEKLLEFDLFDLSTAVSPDIPPTVVVSVMNAPAAFAQGDTNDTVTVNVTNSGASTPTNPSLTLTVSLSPGLSANSIAGVSGGTGWTCVLNTLTCTRTTGLSAGVSDPIVVGVSVTSAPSPTPASGGASASVAGGGLATPVTAGDTFNIKGVPTITWTPAAITYPTPLGAAQLDATASTGGTFVYSPVSGTVLDAGQQTLGVTFTPSNLGNFSVTTSSVVLTVNQGTQTITFTGLPTNATFGSAGPYALNATASSGLAVSYIVSGPASLSGTTLTITGAGTVAVTASQAGNTDYAAATPVTQTTIVGAEGQTITFTGLPTNATFGTAGPYTLNGTANSGLPVSYSVSGPASLSGTTLTITGAGTVSVIASQTGNTNFNAATPVTQTIIVGAASQSITFTGLPTNATFGTAGPYTLNGTASSGLPVSYTISGPATLSGTTLTITGAGTVSVTASQTGNTNFSPATPVTQTIIVGAASQTITFTGLPTAASFGTAGPYTLNGTANSGLPVSYTLSGPATLSGTTLTITGPGTIGVTASQAGNTNFNAATPVTQTIVVSATTGTVVLSATTVYSKVAAGYQAVITIVNNGTGTALNVQMTSAALGVATATTALPVPLGAIASGGGKQIVTVTYPVTAGAAGATVIEKLVATYTGGALTNSGRAVLP